MNRKAFIALTVVAVLLITPASSAFAGLSRSRAQSVTTQSVDEYSADLEAFRDQLQDYYADLVDAYAYVIDAGADPNMLAALETVQQSIPGYTLEDLDLLHDRLSGNEAFWSLPAQLVSWFGPGGPVQATAIPTVVLKADSESLTSHTCPGGTPMGVTDEIIAKAAALAANLVMESLPTDGLTISTRLAAVVAWGAAETALQVLEGINAVADECEQNNHYAILHDIVGPRVDVAVSSRASQASLNSHDANIDADLAAHDANIDADLVAHDANLTNRANMIDASVAALEAKSDALEVKADALADQVTQVQYTLDTQIEKMRVHLQVIEIQEKQRYLLVSTEAGLPVDVTLIGLQVSDGNLNGPITFLDVLSNATITQAKTGILDVAIDLPNAARDAQIFEFMVEHSHGADPSHFGTIVIHRTAGNNLGAGQ